MNRIKRAAVVLLAGVLCLTTAVSPMTSFAEEKDTDSKVSFEVSAGGSLRVMAGQEVYEVAPEDQNFLEISAETGSTLQVEVIPDDGYDAAAYQILSESGDEKELIEDLEAFKDGDRYRIELKVTEDLIMRVSFQKQQAEDAGNGGNQEAGKDTDQIDSESEATDTDLKALTKEGTRETSDLEALFGPKEGKKDTRVSAKAWKKYMEGSAIMPLTEYWSEHLRETDIIVGSNHDDGTIIFQWNEGILGINGEPTFCMDATTSFYDGVQYYPTDAATIGLDAATVTHLALYQEYIYNHRSDLDDTAKYFYTQLLIWRDLNQIYGWNWPNLHIFYGSESWTTVEYQEEVLTSALAWVQEAEASGRYTGHATIYVCEYWQAQAVFWLTENTGSLEIYKYSSNNNLTAKNSCYSMAGAVYGIYTDGEGEPPVATITTTEWYSDNGTVKYGWGKADNLPARGYWVQEIKAPKGFALDKKWYYVTVSGSQTYTLKVTENPTMNPMDPVGVLLKKVDKGTNQNKPQGGATLKGALFEMKYYAVDPNAYNSDPAKSGKTAERTWVFETNKNGFCEYKDQFLYSGDELYEDIFGKPSLPLGIITIQETKAPEGYLLNPEVYVVKITSNNNGSEFVYTYNEPIIPESTLDLNIVKTQKGNDQAIQGAVFKHTLPDGSTENVTTDKNGKVTIKGLTWGKHTIEEVSVPDGYTKNPGKVTFTVAKGTNKITVNSNTANASTGSMTFTVQSDGCAQLKVEDTLAPYELLLHKQNEKGKVLDGAEFTLYSDKACTKKITSGTTSTKGELSFKKLTVGTTYYLKETKAPQGYRIPVNTDGSSIVYEIRTESNPMKNTFEYYVNGKKYTSSTGTYAITGTKAARIVNLTVTNQTGVQLPETGTHTGLILALLGMGCMAAAMICHFRKRKV